MSELSLLVGPRVGQSLREPGDGEIGWRGALGDSRHDGRRHEGERRQKADVAFTKTFAVGDFGEGRDTTEPKVLNPATSFGDGGQQSVAGLGFAPWRIRLTYEAAR